MKMINIQNRKGLVYVEIGCRCWHLAIKRMLVDNYKRAIIDNNIHSHTLICSLAFIPGNSQVLHIPLFCCAFNFYRLLHNIVTVCKFVVILKLCGKIVSVGSVVLPCSDNITGSQVKYKG